MELVMGIITCMDSISNSNYPFDYFDCFKD